MCPNGRQAILPNTIFIGAFMSDSEQEEKKKKATKDLKDIAVRISYITYKTLLNTLL